MIQNSAVRIRKYPRLADSTQWMYKGRIRTAYNRLLRHNAIHGNRWYDVARLIVRVNAAWSVSLWWARNNKLLDATEWKDLSTVSFLWLSLTIVWNPQVRV